MKNDDLGFFGFLVLLAAGFFFFCSDAEEAWPYCLGAAVIGLIIVVLSRLLPEHKGKK